MKITLITPTFNSEGTIRKTLQSIDQQFYENWEHLVIDGGSTDKTLNVLKEHGDKRRIVLSEPDEGIFDALNKGLSLASGDIIGVLHSDDLFKDKRVLNSVVDCFSIGVDVAYGEIEMFNSENKIIRRWKSGSFRKAKLKTGWIPPHTGFFIKKHLKDIRYDLKYSISSDYDYLLKILLGNVKVGHMNRVVTSMALGGNSTDRRNYLRKLKEDKLILRKYFRCYNIVYLLKILRKLRQYL